MDELLVRLLCDPFLTYDEAVRQATAARRASEIDEPRSKPSELKACDCEECRRPAFSPESSRT